MSDSMSCRKGAVVTDRFGINFPKKVIIPRLFIIIRCRLFLDFGIGMSRIASIWDGPGLTAVGIDV